MLNSSLWPEEGLVRLPQVLSVIPVSRSTWLRGVESGRYPRPRKISVRAVAWDVNELRECLAMFDGLQSDIATKSLN